jgi:transcriptional regulator with XRE-family HTH domain
MKYPVLGALIRNARTAVGLDQLELARRMSVGQQAVSGWERGVSRPRQSQVPLLSQALLLEQEEIELAGEYQPNVNNLTQSLLPYLPFDNLSDEAFEAFCRDLFARTYPGRTVSRNGSTGQKQYGVDGFIDGEGERIGVQCKRRQTFGPEDIRAAITEATEEARITSGIIALSRPTASAGTRREIGLHPTWTLLDGEDLSSLLRRLELSDKLSLVDTYFPHLREPFLGIRDPSPWLAPEEYDAALAGRLGVDRNFKLVGRDDELARLIEIAAAPNDRMLLVGRGGIGKSRLLRAFAASDLGRQVVFVSRGAISPSDFDSLPTGAPIVVVDDALDAELDLRSLELGIRRVRPEATLLMSTRPTTLGQLHDALDLTPALAQPVTVTIGDLTMDAAEELAQAALGTVASKFRVEQLARAGYDCPFLIVLAAHLVREGQLKDADLASQTTLRSEILTQFADTVMRGSNSTARSTLLEVLAATQPVRLDEAEFLETLTGVSGLSEDSILDVVDELEDLGLAIRRGTTVRVVPDLLGDAILERALVSRSGIVKQFARKLAERAGGQALAHALRNVSIIDWHRRTNLPSDLADVLWAALTDHAERSPNSERIELTKRASAVAAVSPRRAIAFVDRLFAAPAPDEPDPWGGVFGPPRSITHQSLTYAAAPLIASAGHELEQLPHSMRLLFEIGKGDTRRENSTPEHATRLLRELGQFHPNRPLEFNEAYVREVGEMLEEATSVDDKCTLLSLLRPAVADEVMVTESNGYSMSFIRTGIDLKNVADVRAAAIRIATDALSLGGVIALAAVDVLNDVLQSGDHTADVTPEFSQVVHTLQGLLTDSAQESAVRLAAHRALGWHATYGSGQRRSMARHARAMMFIDDDLLIARSMRSGSFMPDEDEDDDEALEPSGKNENAAVERYHRAMQHAQQTIADLVDRWLTQYNDDEVLARLREIIGHEFREFSGSRSPDLLLRSLFSGRSSLSLRALKTRRPANTVDDEISRVAFAISLHAGSADAETAALAAMQEGETAANAVAAAAMSGHSVLNDCQVRVVRALMLLGYPGVHNTLLTMARWLNAVDESLVMDMVQSAPIEHDTNVADAAAGLLVGGQMLPWSSVPTADREAILSRFVETPQLQPYNIGELLTAHLKIDAAAALSFLHTRIDTGDHRKEYDPLPHVASMGLDFRSVPDLPAIIQNQVEWMLAGTESWRRQFIGIQLLELMLGDFGNDAQALVLGLIRSRDEPRVKLANRILDQGPRNLVIREPAFVANVVETAQLLPDGLAQRVYAGLHGSAEYGMHSRSVGADDPSEIALRDGARSIADRLPGGSALRRFYEDVAKYASARLADERADDASLREPRQWN